jgi:hypothetical protein
VQRESTQEISIQVEGVTVGMAPDLGSSVAGLEFVKGVSSELVTPRPEVNLHLSTFHVCDCSHYSGHTVAQNHTLEWREANMVPLSIMSRKCLADLR